MKKNILILIPARMNSTRFPGKPLALIHGRPLIQWTYENFQKSDNGPWNFHSVVVTDHPLIEEVVHKFHGNVCRVDDDVPSGTERIQLAYERFFSQEKGGKTWDLVVNVQGDEPLVTLEIIKNLVHFHWENRLKFSLGTIVRQRLASIHHYEEFSDPNKVKVVFVQKTGECLYFSRAEVPYKRDRSHREDIGVWHQHIGVYSFLPQSLNEFVQCPMGEFENLEKLEQLRALEHGMKIGAISLDESIQLQGADVPEDLHKLEQILVQRKPNP